MWDCGAKYRDLTMTLLYMMVGNGHITWLRYLRFNLPDIPKSPFLRNRRKTGKIRWGDFDGLSGEGLRRRYWGGLKPKIKHFLGMHIIISIYQLISWTANLRQLLTWLGIFGTSVTPKGPGLLPVSQVAIQ